MTSEPACLNLAPVACVRSDGERLALAGATEAARRKAHMRESICFTIWQANAGGKRLVEPLCKRIAAELSQPGFGWVQIRRFYYDWQAAGRTITPLVPRSGAPTTIKPEAVAFIHGWMQRNSRSGKQGWRDFIEQHWRAGHPVPGYGTWRDWYAQKWPERALPASCPPDLPYGWGYENLIRKLDKVETAAARRGIGAALSELPPIPGTRAGMRPLEWITFDDVKLDFRVHVPSIGRPVDLVALVAFDIATGMILGFGLRPVLLDEDGRGTKLKRRDSKALLVQVLQRWGCPSYGMHIIQELGTAHVDAAFKAALREATGDLVQVHDASMIAGTVWAGGFADRAVGNSRAKSWIESTFNPLHNRLAAIEGQTGRRYDVAPQDDAGRRKELKALVDAGEKIPEHLRAQLKMPYRSLADASPLIGDAIRALNARTDHAMKDFDDMLVWRFRAGEPWKLEAEMLEFEPAALASIETDTVTESPAIRYARLLGAEQRQGTQFFTLHDDSAARLLEDQKEIAIERGQVCFQLEGKTCLYSPYTASNVPVLEAMDDGRKYIAYFDASNGQIPPRVLYVTDGKGRYLGALEHTAGIRRADAEAAAAAIGKKKAMLNAALARVNANSPQVAEENEARIAANLDVLARAGAVEEIAPTIDGAHRAAAPAAHTAATVEIAERARVAAKAARIDPSAAAREETRRQRTQLSHDEKNPAPAAQDDGSWA